MFVACVTRDQVLQGVAGRVQVRRIVHHEQRRFFEVSTLRAQIDIDIRNNRVQTAGRRRVDDLVSRVIENVPVVAGAFVIRVGNLATIEEVVSAPPIILSLKSLPNRM